MLKPSNGASLSRFCWVIRHTNVTSTSGVLSYLQPFFKQCTAALTHWLYTTQALNSQRREGTGFQTFVEPVGWRVSRWCGSGVGPGYIRVCTLWYLTMLSWWPLRSAKALETSWEQICGQASDLWEVPGTNQGITNRAICLGNSFGFSFLKQHLCYMNGAQVHRHRLHNQALSPTQESM